ncbi:MAG: tetratricopeptide repeat protein [Candidatus Acidiferrales bacterium]
MRFRCAVIILIGLYFFCASATDFAQTKAAGKTGAEHRAETAQAQHLGSVAFSTSCSSAVQDQFNTAVAWLHSFQYASAKRAFEQVAEQDPHCAMAYWGEAMSIYYPIWNEPTQKTRKEGWDDIDKAKSLGAKTEREQEYIAAVEAFYRDPDKDDYDARTAAYARAMEQLYTHYPQDHDAAAFYGLSLIAEEPPKDAPLVNRKKAGAILEKLFAEEPNHPGAAHYLIHAYDTPELAPMALEAARAYAKIAPASAHALHMPSHIFSRLGFWQESIDSNLASAGVAAKAARLGEQGASYQLHAMDFLEYAYLQTGQDQEAQSVIDDLDSAPKATADEITDHREYFVARYVLETHHWTEAARLKPEKGADASTTYWARAIGAARIGDIVVARESLAKLKGGNSDMHSHKSSGGVGERSVQQLEAAAWVAFAEAKKDEALKTMRAAVERQEADRLEDLEMPAREVLGDMLLELQQPAEALAAYEAALKEAPNRFDSLYGAGRAAELAGDTQKANSYYSKLIEQSIHADGRVPELQQARVFLARK